jgi:hypothetical protein
MRALLFAAKIEAAGHTRISNGARSARVAARPFGLHLYFAANLYLVANYDSCYIKLTLGPSTAPSMRLLLPVQKIIPNKELRQNRKARRPGQSGAITAL